MGRIACPVCGEKSNIKIDKIRLALDTMMKAYDIPKDDRKAAIEKVLAKDYEQMARDMFDKFVKRLDNDIEKNE